LFVGRGCRPSHQVPILEAATVDGLIDKKRFSYRSVAALVGPPKEDDPSPQCSPQENERIKIPRMSARRMLQMSAATSGALKFRKSKTWHLGHVRRNDKGLRQRLATGVTGPMATGLFRAA